LGGGGIDNTKKDRKMLKFIFTMQADFYIYSSSVQINFLDNNLAVIELRSLLLTFSGL
jgi:hypothetical protein